MQLYKLFREPKLNLGCVPHRPDQVHQRGFRHQYAKRSLRPDTHIMRSDRPHFHDLRVAGEPAMRGSSVFIRG